MTALRKLWTALKNLATGVLSRIPWVSGFAPSQDSGYSPEPEPDPAISEAERLRAECPESFTSVAEDVIVIRMVNTKVEFLPVGQSYPNRIAFEPSSDDKKEAIERNRPVTVSVWDKRRSMVSEIRAIRAADAAAAGRASPAPSDPFQVMVAKIHAAGEKHGVKHFDVVTDPIVPTKGPGSNGHCGVTGCQFKAAPPLTKLEHKAMLDRLAKSCKRVPD